ncbi:MAG: hypothetical protein WCI27_05930 [Candidatus Omnitrophota bacterium]
MNFNNLKNIKFNLNDLKKFNLTDLTKLTDRDVRDYVNQHSLLVINIAIVSAAVIVFFVFLNITMNEYKSLKLKQELLIKKEQPLRNYEKASKDLADFIQGMRTSLPPMKFISYITGKATLHHVVINVFNPLQMASLGYYNTVNLAFTASATKFKDMMLFIHDLEASEYMTKIDSLSLQNVIGGNSLDGKAGNNFIQVIISVSALQLVENDGNKNSKKK